ncbi:MAG: hypothetical protein EZS28_024240 [Streblomastix strix]|uniref:SPRY domain-containing protein n=1 Tax=Streblomastix strix TaxID=222440 RepID=A0A5J4VCY1_9EUKA|nr:MAG: hypothetical protein EZS28_024240 [Streblomastix strix]
MKKIEKQRDGTFYLTIENEREDRRIREDDRKGITSADIEQENDKEEEDDDEEEDEDDDAIEDESKVKKNTNDTKYVYDDNEEQNSNIDQNQKKQQIYKIKNNSLVDKRNVTIALGRVLDNELPIKSDSPLKSSESYFVQLEIVFSGTDPYTRAVGIVADASHFPLNFVPGRDKSSLEYVGSGHVYQNSERYSANKSWGNGDQIIVEIEVRKGESSTIHFFINGEQQPLFFTKAPEDLQFCARLFKGKSTFEVRRIERSGVGIAVQLKNEIFVEWGSSSVGKKQ